MYEAQLLAVAMPKVLHHCLSLLGIYCEDILSEMKRSILHALLHRLSACSVCLFVRIELNLLRELKHSPRQVSALDTPAQADEISRHERGQTCGDQTESLYGTRSF